MWKIISQLTSNMKVSTSSRIPFSSMFPSASADNSKSNIANLFFLFIVSSSLIWSSATNLSPDRTLPFLRSLITFVVNWCKCFKILFCSRAFDVRLNRNGGCSQNLMKRYTNISPIMNIDFLYSCTPLWVDSRLVPIAVSI